MADTTSRPNEQREYPDIATQGAELHRLIDAITNQDALWGLTQLAQTVLQERTRTADAHDGRGVGQHSKTPEVLASAARDPEVDVADITYALRGLSEHLHAIVAIWRAWREHQDEDEAEAPRQREGTIAWNRGGNQPQRCGAFFPCRAHQD